MTTFNKTVGAPLTMELKWQHIKWNVVIYHVRKLQLRIAKAFKAGRYCKVKALQWLLTHSFYAKLLAIKRVTQNKGKNTPGVDGEIWKTNKEKMAIVKRIKRRGYRSLPLRRVHIPKKNGKLRPLGIPTKIDLTQQALYLLALEPISEMSADKNSYGFRPHRSVHDAIEQCFIVLSRKQSAKWILEGDIKSCFDKISHEWLLNNTLMDKDILKQWLKAGYIEKDAFHHTYQGSCQGSCISPTLANITLDGMETILKSNVKNGEKINFIRYADDWICTSATKEILENKVLPVIIKFLKERGLELSLEKTKITHIEEGFDFLGFNIRKYRNKLLIKPSKPGIKRFLDNTRKIIKSMKSRKTEDLVNILNTKIQGWTNFYRHSVAKNIFNYIDSNIFSALWRWAKRKHPKKSAKWIKDKYYIKIGSNNRYFFSGKQGEKKGMAILKSASKTRITKYVKIKADANPYDPTYKEYLKKRLKKSKGE
jgi:RNA-directed DNA polymerase